MLFEIEDISKKEIKTNELLDSNMISCKQKMKKAQKLMMRKQVAAEILEKCDLKEGEMTEVVVNGQSNAGGFFEHIIEKWKGCDHLCISTWIMNRYYIDFIDSCLKNGKLKKLTFIISDRMSQLGGGHQANFNLMKYQFTKNKNIEFRVAKNHSKVYSMKKDDKYLTISGSGNWSENPRIENYIFISSKESYKFHSSWMKEIIEK